MLFSWDGWNSEHVKKHGSNQADAEYAIEHAESPFPQDIGAGKYRVWGRTSEGRFLEVIFTLKLPEEIEFRSLTLLDWSTLIDKSIAAAIYVCHAMPMTARQVKQYRKIQR